MNKPEREDDENDHLWLTFMILEITTTNYTASYKQVVYVHDHRPMTAYTVTEKERGIL